MLLLRCASLYKPSHPANTAPAQTLQHFDRHCILLPLSLSSYPSQPYLVLSSPQVPAITWNWQVNPQSYPSGRHGLVVRVLLRVESDVGGIDEDSQIQCGYVGYVGISVQGSYSSGESVTLTSASIRGALNIIRHSI